MRDTYNEIEDNNGYKRRGRVRKAKREVAWTTKDTMMDFVKEWKARKAVSGSSDIHSVGQGIRVDW